MFKAFVEDSKAVKIRVGAGATQARWWVDSPAQIRELLRVVDSNLQVMSVLEAVNLWGHQRTVTLTPYLASNSAGNPCPAMIICPGGAYREHAEHEGEGYAKWLSQHGVHCFVLAYRLGSEGHRHPAPLEDLTRAIRLVRHHAAKWKVDPRRVGIMGSSAGGHLVSTVLTRFDRGVPDSIDPVERECSRPDAAILCYPVISMEAAPHNVSRANLLGPSPRPELLLELSNERHVTRAVPPCFIWHTCEDKSVSVAHSLSFAQALAKAEVPFELHIYPTGRHGMGLATEHPWGESCISWLHRLHFLG